MDEIERKIALALLVIMEEGGDEWADVWLTAGLSARHEGDCELAPPHLQAPATCHRCAAEEQVKWARAVVNAIEASGHVIVPACAGTGEMKRSREASHGRDE